MPDEKVRGVKPSQIRASTGRERIGDMLRSAFESITEQPLVRISDALGLSDLRGVANEVSNPDPNRMKLGMMPMGPGMLRGRMAQPARTGLPNEFQRLDNPHFAPSRHSIDPDVMPPGRMEYLDPDIEMIMNPSPVDVTTRQGQQKLRALMGR